MIIKITNRDEKFYQYMGRFFGSRLVEKQTNDRIYDDDDKEWYIYIEQEKVRAFISISKNVIKNIYAVKKEYLKEILQKVMEENEISYSVVTNYYMDIYKESGFQIDESQNYKKFTAIYMKPEKG